MKEILIIFMECVVEVNIIKNHSFFKNKTLYLIFLFLTLSIIIIIVGYNNFIYHRDTVVEQQQEHILTIAKSISTSLEESFNYKINSLSLLSKEPLIVDMLRSRGLEDMDSSYEEVLKKFFSNYSDEMERISLLNPRGELLYQWPAKYLTNDKIIDDSIIENVLNSKEAFIGREYLSYPNQFSIDIIQPVISGNRVEGILVSTIDLNKTYEKLIHPVKAGEKGYGMVKNKDGFIVMHPVKDQIGIESLKVRKAQFPDVDWGELEELSRRQVEEGEGYYIYHSKWWQHDRENLTKKINAYTTFENGNIAWIISVQMDYKEIEEPIKGAFINISLISLIIIIILMSVFYTIFKINKKREALELESKYLKKLNQAWQDLIKSETMLRHSQKLQTIGTLTSGIVHEFNNLLSPILGYSEIILGDLDSDSPIYEDILEIQKSALKAKEIMDYTLAYSRQDKIFSLFEKLQINDVIRESIKLIKAILPYNIEMVEDLSSSHFIHGDLTQLQQVLINLYNNSYHAMKEKGGVLEISSKDIYISHKESGDMNLSNGHYVVIQVKDDGIGMDEKTLEHIFDHFFTTKDTGQGTGLGMAVVKEIIDKHNGKILINSELNIGTSVKIYIPVIKE